MIPPISEKPIVLRRSWWYFALPLVALAAIVIAFCYMLDQSFSIQKREVVRSPAHLDELTEIYLEFAKDARPKSVASALDAEDFYEMYGDEIEEAAQEVVEGDNIFWKIVIESRSDEILLEIENPEKHQRLNNWSNCLLSRNFSGELVRMQSGRSGANFYARIRFFYASPIGWPEIDRLLFWYRWAVVAVLVSTTLLFIWLNRSLLRPLVRIAHALESLARGGRVDPFDGATTVFERTFNELAESQRTVRLQTQLEQTLQKIRTSHHPEDTSEALLDCFPQLVSETYNSRDAALYRWDGDRTLKLSSHANNQNLKNGSIIPDEKLVAADWDAIETDPQQRAAYWLPLRSRSRLVGALYADFSASINPEEAAANVRRILEHELESARTDADRLAEERNRFGMTLATSMGHDLTNIIATSKWDLQTLEQALNLGMIQVDPERESHYYDAVAGLRQNMHFLQDIVDIYRAVGYARRPSYEEAEVGQLIQEVAELFGRSISRRLDIKCHAVEPVVLSVEPRLLKMVVFNLLANASQAIQSRDDGKSGGRIDLTVQPCADGASVSVRDDGPGIRNNQGKRLSGDELHKIFRAGYSTKPAEASGGLGLSWVKHIVETFHEGKITARNHPDGGAEFVMLLRRRS